MAFEGHGPPAVFLSRAAVLASFATGRPTAVVVDMGHEATTGERMRGAEGSVLFWSFCFYNSSAGRGGLEKRGVGGKERTCRHRCASPPPPAPPFLFPSPPPQMSSFSMLNLSAWIWVFSWEPSFVVTEQAMTC